jgi:hypothetical protein
MRPARTSRKPAFSSRTSASASCTGVENCALIDACNIDQSPQRRRNELIASDGMGLAKYRLDPSINLFDRHVGRPLRRFARSPCYTVSSPWRPASAAAIRLRTRSASAAPVSPAGAAERINTISLARLPAPCSVRSRTRYRIGDKQILAFVPRRTDLQPLWVTQQRMVWARFSPSPPAPAGFTLTPPSTTRPPAHHPARQSPAPTGMLSATFV